MNKIKCKLAILLSAVLICITVTPYITYAEELYEKAMDATDEYLEKNVTDEAWAVFARGRNLEADHTDDYYVSYYENLDTNALSSSGDCAKALLALRASGRGNSEKAAALIDKIENSTTFDVFSAPTVIESLSDINGTDALKTGIVTRFSSEIAKHTYSGYEMVDTDGMYAAALSTFSGNETTRDSLITYLDSKQDATGNIVGTWGGSPEATAQAVVALSLINKVDDISYKYGDVSTGKSTLDGMLSYYDDNSKKFDKGYTYCNDITAYQTNYALVAYDRSVTPGATSLFDFSDVKNVYYFSFDGNGSSNSMKTQAITSGDSKNLNASTLIKSGYSFIGWVDDSGNTYSNEQLVTASKDVKLYAIWQRLVSSSGGSNPLTSAINTNADLEAMMKVDSKNAVTGTWVSTAKNCWSFLVDGKPFTGGFIVAMNPAAGLYSRAGKFYFDQNGNMVTGWKQIAGEDGILRWYYFNPVPDNWYGACYINTTTPDGYVVDENGAWMDPSIVSEEAINKVLNSSPKESGSSSSSSSSTTEETNKKTNKISVSVSVSGNTISGSEEVTISKNSSAFDALKALAKKMGWSVSGSGSYVKGIGGEMEKSAGALSGWTYSVNGTNPNKSSGSYKLSDGDSVDWIFVDGPSY